MAKSAKILSDNFISHLGNIENTRKKSEKLFREGKLTNRDLNLIYSGLFMEAVVSFERFIEDLFTDLLCGRIVHDSKRVKTKTLFSSYQIARDVLLGERTYIDWLPFSRHTTKRAKKFFKNGLPFTGLGIDVKTQINIDKKVSSITERLSIIRNALAHKSEHSLKIFDTEIISKTTALHSKEKNPIGYLRGLHTSHPIPTTRYEQIINDIKFVSVLLTSKKLK